MCNLYSMMADRAEVILAVRAMRDRGGNRPPQAGVFPDHEAPVVVVGEDGQREMRDMRWGMPTPPFLVRKWANERADKQRAKGIEFDYNELVRNEPDKGVTNVRNIISETTGELNRHWVKWLAPGNRCLVPFTSFAEPDQDGEGTKQNIWFALDETRPLAFFAGLHTPHACVRMKSKGWEEIATYAFLTTASAEPVKTYHKKATPVILTDPADWDLWLSGAWDEVKHLQRSLPDGRLKIVARGAKQDGPAAA